MSEQAQQAINDEQIIAAIIEAQANEEAWSRVAKQNKEELFRRNQQQIESALQKKDEPFGSVPLKIGTYKVTVNVPKKVTWDQAKLANLCKTIAADGGKPEEYIKIKYEVSETAYKIWGSNIKTYFEDARTVDAGNPSIKIEEI